MLPEFCHANAFDGNPLTYFRIYNKVDNIWIGLEFDESKRITKVVYIRNFYPTILVGYAKVLMFLYCCHA